MKKNGTQEEKVSIVQKSKAVIRQSTTRLFKKVHKIQIKLIVNARWQYYTRRRRIVLLMNVLYAGTCIFIIIYF